MVDLETLGTAPGSVILSIGAVRFGDELLPGRVDLTPENSCYLTANVESSVAARTTTITTLRSASGLQFSFTPISSARP